MIQQISPKLIERQDLSPLVSLRHDLAQIAREHAWELIQDKDDVDDYTALVMHGISGPDRGQPFDIIFGLKSYSHDPQSVVDVLLPLGLLADPEAPGIILRLVEEIGAGAQDVVWPRQIPPAWQVLLPMPKSYAADLKRASP